MHSSPINSKKCYLLTLLVLWIINCGEPLPLQEITDAKQEFTRATFFKADKYASEEYELAKKSLYSVHEIASSDKPDSRDITKASKASFQKSREAIIKSIPFILPDYQKESDLAIRASEEAMGDILSGDNYNRAKSLKKEADLGMDRLNRSKSDAKSITQDTLDEYEGILNKYSSSISLAEKSKTISLSQVPQLLDSTSDINENINIIEKYAEGSEPKVKDFRKRYSNSISDMESGKVKLGFTEMDKLRLETTDILNEKVTPLILNKLELANAKISEAEKILSGLNKEEIEKNDIFKENEALANESLTNAKDSVLFSKENLGKGKYSDSIHASEDALKSVDTALKSVSMIAIDKKQQITQKKNSKETKDENIIKEDNAKIEKENNPPKKNSSATKPKKNLVKKSFSHKLKKKSG